MVARALITSALEETWPEEGPVLFLGEWCRLYGRKLVWSNLDAEVVPYHWDDRRKLHQDYLFLRKINEEILQILTLKLNSLHGKDHSIRYWRILIGPWLGYFIQMLFDRWFMLKKAVEDYKISNVRVVEYIQGELVPNDMANFSSLYVGDDWNEMIYGHVLEGLSKQVDVVYVSRANMQQRERGVDSPPSISILFKKYLSSWISQASGAFSRDDDFFFINTYLGVKNDCFLQARLGQLPKLWRSVGVPRFNYSLEIRQWNLPRLNTILTEEYNDFIDILLNLIPRHLPKVYLEGYSQLIALTESLPWPQKPQGIFTSNAYSSDDIFKSWAASKVEKGAPLIIGQHGGHYGMGLWSFTEEHQIAISDSFLSWGWDEPSQAKIIPTGNLKGFGQKHIASDSSGLALMVEMAIPRYSYHLYSLPISAGQWSSYFEDQCRFIDALPHNLRRSFLIRLYVHDYGYSQEERWRERFPEINLDEGRQSIDELMKKSRIYIGTYNATTYLETLSINFPTIIFWDANYWELRDGVKPYFEMLKKVGILHETPESAARQLMAVWADVSAWWNSSAVQAARKEFCERYANTPKNPLKIMEALFCNISESSMTKVAGSK